MLEWLTKEEKQEKLLNLRKEMEDRDLDLLFLPYLTRFNTLSDVCTTQCCTGHKGDPDKDGYLSLRFSFQMEAYFKYHSLAEILEIPSVIQVEENYEMYNGLARQRTVMWFKHEGWKETIETILMHTQKAHKLMRRGINELEQQ